jgi:hypothetical protein
VRRKRCIQLILDHARLDPSSAPLWINREDAIHVTRQIDDEPVGKRLTIGACAAPTGRDSYRDEPLVSEKLCDAHEVFGVAGESDRLRGNLVYRVVRGHDGAFGIVHAQIARKATCS